MKFKTTFYFALLFLLSFAAWGAGFQTDLKQAMPAIRLDTQRSTAIHNFAMAAKIKDIKAMLDLFVPAARQAEGDEELLKYFNEKIIPFFASYEKLHTYKTIEPRTMPDNNIGYRYYTYFINGEGEEIPFDIIVMESGEKTI